MAKKLQGLTLLDGAIEADRQSFEAGGGVLIAYTNRSPDKETENEDTVAVIPWDPDSVVLVVADGAGGLPAGKRASHAAVLALANSMQADQAKTTLLRSAVLNGIDAANDAVRELANGSATTLTVVTVEGRLARSYQIGDSEAIVIGNRGRIKSQTTAHSPTGFAVEAGFLDQRAALHHKERHLVSNFIGSIDMSVDMGAEVELAPRDTIIVVSDGVTDNVHIEEIVELARKGPLELAADAVLAKVVRRMSTERAGQPRKPDDVSLILFRKPVLAQSS